ncbi:MAG TPA: GGDEF domain-containing protein [Tepidisphaeraceae bacterium]|nr:GGDEF domain-containing protein [Tepidisphaeraceae bacterium]
MPVIAQERILLVGDNERQLHAALSQVLPSAHISATATYFDAIGELAGTTYTSVLAAASPIERRPEPAIQTLRQAAGEARLLLFGEPGLEPLARKMLEFGLDDYLVTPVNPVELGQMFGTPPMRLAAEPASDGEQPTTIAPSRIELLGGLPLAEILLDAMLHHPHDGSRAALNQLNARLGPATQLAFTSPSAVAPSVPEGQTILSHGVRCDQQPGGTLHLVIPRDEDQTTARHLLAQLAILFGQLMTVEERHNRLQRLAISDDLTGLYNGRYFRIFLAQILQKALAKKFLVTLLLFDIDNFKSYNDRYGHAVGDEILKQTAKLIRSCCREHDHVARISGDEFGVIFWEKEGPRQPRDPKPGASASRVPQNIVQILERFQYAIANSDLKLLGAHGKGVLSISGGLAVYPHDAQTAEALCAAADSALMFGAKKSGKNSIFLVGAAEPHHPNNP